MADALVIFDGSGSLPQKTTFQAPGDGNFVFVLSGTAWTENGPTTLAIDLLLDGEPIGQAMCYANQNSSHQVLRTTFIPYSELSYGEHTITLQAGNGYTVTDVNDYYQVVLL